MTSYFHSYEECANAIVAQVGTKIVLGVPLGLGKPCGIVNALFRLALNDVSIQLTIVTGLTLARPRLDSELEKRFLAPILNRILKDYEDPLYERYREQQRLPHNINVIEFFLMPGKFLHNHYVQQNYISSGYSSVVSDVDYLGINVFAQQVAPPQANTDHYSLSCNTDVFHHTRSLMKLAEMKGRKIAILAEVNANLPFMPGQEAEVAANLFSFIVDTKKYRALFALPRDEVSIQDHMIGLYTSSLIKDNGCLQVGIGKLSNALANALIFRQRENDAYREFMQPLLAHERFDLSLADEVTFDVFAKGLYASTEMLSDEYLHLYHHGMLKKRVYDHIGLQTLLNNNMIGEDVTPEMVMLLVEHQLIHPRLTSADVLFLQTFGILKSTITLRDDHLVLPSGEKILADFNIVTARNSILDKCLGDTLRTGKIMHAGFILGSVDLYSALHRLPKDELQRIEMSSISRTNTLLWSPELLQLQRQHARFVNSALMVTLVGGVISDGLQDYQELSGVGGQYDFVSMSKQLPGSRSIINCRSTRKAKNKVVSNIVWEYSNSTIPRYLRDIVITEYGIADCRSKTDADVIKAMLNIADSRFQPDLLVSAKKSGKLPLDYQIPVQFKNNYPDTLMVMIKPVEALGYCQFYPFGSDLTKDEQRLARAFVYLKTASKMELFSATVAALFYACKDASIEACLQRIGLASVNNIQDYFYSKLLKYVLHQHSL